jgi:uncharacterized membrane protein
MESILDQNLFIYRTIALFAIFSFMGWLLEVVYRSVTNRRLINPGYLYGPFVPIYGAGGILVMIAGIFLSGFSLTVQMISFALLTTTLEFAAGVILSAIFGCRLWSYEGYRFNYKGIICLRYAFIWSVLAWVFYYLIFPVTYLAICRVPDTATKIAVLLFILYLAADLTLSTLTLLDFFRRLRVVYAGITTFSNEDFAQYTERFRRLLGAFPDLARFMERTIADGVSVKLGTMLSRFIHRTPAAVKKKDVRVKPIEPEYIEIISDIISNAEYRKLRNFYHHNTTIYEHLQYVSYISYRMAKALGLDYRSATRGALLHDFFLYDWHTHDEPDLPKNKNHGLAHPRIALGNARKHFTLNRIEEDIIVKHMWPFTLRPPRYMESYVVTFADKFSASREYSLKLHDFFTIGSLRLRNRKKK